MANYVSVDVSVVYQNGLPVISVRLPSRRERCQFTLKPLSDTVGVFLQQLQAEDRGIDRVAIYSTGRVQHASHQHLWNRNLDKSSFGLTFCSMNEWKWKVIHTKKKKKKHHKNVSPYYSYCNDFRSIRLQKYTSIVLCKYVVCTYAVRTSFVFCFYFHFFLLWAWQFKSPFTFMENQSWILSLMSYLLLNTHLKNSLMLTKAAFKKNTLKAYISL